MTVLSSEQEFLQVLKELVAKADNKEVYVHYEFPSGNLFVTGFQPIVNIEGREITIPLQLKSPSDLIDNLFLFALPDEEESNYRSFADDVGDLFLEIVFPHCTHWRAMDTAQYAKLQFATKKTLLDRDENSPVVQQVVEETKH